MGALLIVGGIWLACGSAWLGATKSDLLPITGLGVFAGIMLAAYGGSVMAGQPW